MKARRVLWVSTSRTTRGGVASFVRTMEQTPLWNLWGVHHVATHRDGSVAARLRAFAAGLGAVIWQLLVHRPDLVHLHTASYGSFARKSVVAWLARGRGIPVVLHVHGGAFHQFFARSPRPVQRYITATLEHSSIVIALGETWAQRLQLIAPHAEITVLANAVRPGAAVPQPEPGAPVQVLFLGDVSEEKGAFMLIDVWAQLASDTRRPAAARLVMAGAGEVERGRDHVQALGLGGEVSILGWVDPAGLEVVLRSSHVLALPSRNEGQPMAVLEAMARGLCVVVTDVGGVPDLVDADCAILIPVDQPVALLAALREVVTDHRRRAALGAAALRRVEERFDVEVAWRSLDSLYRKLAP